MRFSLNQILRSINPNKKNLDKKLVIVFQMGKVASMSVTSSLRKLDKFNVFHLHNLDMVSLQRAVNDPKNKNRKIYNIESSLKFIENHLNKNDSFKIISMARDPVARNISDFFQNLFKYLPDEGKEDDYPVEDMIKAFLNNYQHRRPLIWFDQQLKNQLGIDIFQHEFDKTLGYKIIQSNDRPTLIFKTEISDSIKVQIINDFLKINLKELKTTNLSSAKPYKAKYSEFLKTIKLPDEYLDEMYNSKYAKHFYTEEELQKFRKRWKTDS